jgi:hypothetical protein
MDNSKDVPASADADDADASRRRGPAPPGVRLILGLVAAMPFILIIMAAFSMYDMLSPKSAQFLTRAILAINMCLTVWIFVDRNVQIDKLNEIK